MNPGEQRHAPFYCGTQRADWHCYNCARCTKGYDEETRQWRCDLEKKIDESYLGDGTVDAETARRMGEPSDCTVYNWRCPEFDPAPPPPPAPRFCCINKPADWIAEWAASRGIKLEASGE